MLKIVKTIKFISNISCNETVSFNERSIFSKIIWVSSIFFELSNQLLMKHRCIYRVMAVWIVIVHARELIDHAGIRDEEMAYRKLLVWADHDPIVNS